MTDAVEAAAAIDGGGGVPLNAMADVVSRSADVHATTFDVANRMLNRVLAAPGTTDARPDLLKEMRGGTDGSIGEMRKDIVSAIDRPDVTPREDAEITEGQVMVETLKGMLVHGAKYHMIWNVTKTTQRDLTHILKST